MKLFRIASLIGLVIGFALLARPHQPIDAAVLTAGNGIYTVKVNDQNGSYTAITGASHPAGPGLNVLFLGASGTPNTSNTMIHGYPSGADYIVGLGEISPVALPSLAVVTPIGTTGFRLTWNTPAASPDSFHVVMDVNVTGTTIADSFVRVTTTITSLANTDLQRLGIRYLWDFKSGNDDGPTFQAQSPDGAVLTTETNFTNPTFARYKIQDNDSNAVSPSVISIGTVSDVPVPNLLQFVCWRNNMTFVQTINPALTISSPTGICDNLGNQVGGDSAVAYVWGPDINSALTLSGSGSSITVTEAITLAVMPATLTVHKDFSDTNTSNVAISVTCSGGASPAVSPLNARDNPDTPAVFTINNVPPSGTTCTATETTPAGYTQTGNTCNNVAVALGVSASCTLTNSLPAVAPSVTPTATATPTATPFIPYIQVQPTQRPNVSVAIASILDKKTPTPVVAVPQIVAPNAGTGITVRPPNTGDGGLSDRHGNAVPTGMGVGLGLALVIVMSARRMRAKV